MSRPLDSAFNFQRSPGISLQHPWTVLILVCFEVFCLLSSGLYAADVEVKLSSKETYIGLPIQLQIAISNAQDYQEPKFPEVDGLDIRSSGVPSQSRQISIYNGRRVERTSVILQYEITPKREGMFEIPSLTFEVDGHPKTIEAMTIIASKSETGDLLYVSIEGNKKEIYVGEALEVKLRIWLKPFQDRERKITLSEGNMWQMISEKTQWGPFQEKLHELAAQNQRPGGDEVLREDGKGRRRSYYLYEIETTIYPKRVGKIEGEEVQIVVSYPEKLGNSRSPLDGAFGNSPLSQMMDDDFFSSAFGNRLSITKVRPIVAQAEVEEIRVLPVPQEGKPADYQGAIGEYRIEVEASPTSVKAGDPISLRIGIRGSGPMEFVQAPPLSELPEITDQFKISRQPLAGFVRGDTKFFQTEIRPKHEGVKEIPPIPFSFFDPETREYKTVHSQPIAIEVSKADVLEFDSIVDQGASKSIQNKSMSSRSLSEVAATIDTNFRNYEAPDVLTNESLQGSQGVLWTALGLPPALFCAALVARGLNRLIGKSWRRRNATRICLNRLENCTEPTKIIEEIQHWLSLRLSKDTSTIEHAIGELRNLNAYEGAARLESLIDRLQRVSAVPQGPSVGADLKNQALQVIRDLDRSIRDSTAATVRLDHRNRSGRSPQPTVKSMERIVPILLVSLLVGPAFSRAQERPNSRREEPSVESLGPQETYPLGHQTIQFDAQQKKQILDEANALYALGLEKEVAQSTTKPEEFSRAAEKYQQLVDSGIENAKLYFNLANAYLKSGQLGRALANYERSERLGLESMTLMRNRFVAESMVTSMTQQSKDDLSWFESIARRSGGLLEGFVRAIRLSFGSLGLAGLVVFVSLSLWGPMVWWTVRSQPIRKAWLLAPLLAWTILAMALVIHLQKGRRSDIAFSAIDQLRLRSDGDEDSDVLQTLENANGCPLKIINDRGDWVRVETPSQNAGWVAASEIAKAN